MSVKTVISEKFVATYKRHADRAGHRKENGFLGHDSSSGGYPYFTDSPDSHYLRDSVMDAIKDARMIETNMRSYHGNDEVDFDSIAVVRHVTSIETIDDLEQASHDALVASARSKITDDEFSAFVSEVRERG